MSDDVQYGKTLRESTHDLVAAAVASAPSIYGSFYVELEPNYLNAVTSRVNSGKLKSSFTFWYDVKAIEFKNTSEDGFELDYYIQAHYSAPSNMKTIDLVTLNTNVSTNSVPLEEGEYVLFNSQNNTFKTAWIAHDPLNLSANLISQSAGIATQYNSNYIVRFTSTYGWSSLKTQLSEIFNDIDTSSSTITLLIANNVRTNNNFSSRHLVIKSLYVSFTFAARSKENPWSDEEDEEQSKANLISDEEDEEQSKANLISEEEE